MADPARSDVRSGGVVRPLSRAATRRCSRPGCPTPATATLTFRYDQQHASLVPLAPDGGPETYDLCRDHADRTRPPHGWTLRDGRPDEIPVDTPDASALGSERTVALLAAALRGQPTAVPDAAEPPVDVAALDAIVAEPFDEPDLFGTSDEADPAEGQASGTAPADALSELSALSGHGDDHAPARSADDPDDPDEAGSVVEQVPARTVPGAHRPD